MIWASLAFTVVYVAIALQGPRVWGFAKGPGTRLLGVLIVQAMAVGVGFLAFMLVAAGLLEGRAPNPAATRSILIPITTILFSFIAAIGHWSKHSRDGDAKGTLAVKSNLAYVRGVSDPLKAELHRREEAANEQRRLDDARIELETLLAEQALLLATPSPHGDPRGWSTEALRAEIERRGRLEQVAAQIAQLGGDVRPAQRSPDSSRPKVEPFDRRKESEDLKRRLAALQDWNERQRS